MSRWSEKTLADLFDFSGGRSASRADLSTKGYPYLHYGDIHGSTKTFIDVCADETIPRLDVDLNKISNNSLLNDGDVVFVDASEDDDGTSRHIVVRNGAGVPFIAGLHTIVAKAKTDDLDKRFREFCFQTTTVKDQFKFYAVGTKVTGVNKSTIGKITLSFPEYLPEQRRIAEVLSDMDALLAAMEKLIAKKRAIKQGAMQELLTGKRRLSGFEGEWEWVELGTYTDILRGASPRPIQAYITVGNGGINWIKIGDVTPGAKYITSTEERIIPEGIAFSRTVGKGDFILSNSMSFGRPYILNIDGCIHDGWLTIQNYQINFDTDFLYYLLGSESTMLQYRNMAAGSSVQNLNKEKVSKLIVHKPPKVEQTAIASILSDMDTEIDILTAKLNKLRTIKQGMMSELLTGHIRLTEQQAEAVPAQKGGHNQQFDDAVMIAGIVNVLYSDAYPLGRKKVQKCLYLLRRHQNESTVAFKKKAAGPYADEVRYKGGEPIAQSAKYITRTDTRGKGTTFARGEKISQALDYIQNWGKQADIKWVADKLKFKKVDELELLATVDMAICDLTEAGIPVSVASIKHLIATNEEWKAKLKKQTFTDANINHAIQELRTLLSGGITL